MGHLLIWKIYYPTPEPKVKPDRVLPCRSVRSMDRFVGRQAPGTARVVQAHTGAEFESGAVHRARGVNEPVPGVEPDEPAGAGEWAGGHDNFRQVSGRKKRLRSTPHSKVVDDPRRSKAGQKLTIFKSEKPAEDERWVYIVEVKSNGTMGYICVACGKDFTGGEDKVIAHKLQLGGVCAACPRPPSAECRLVLERIRNAKLQKHAAGGRLSSNSPVQDVAVAQSKDVGGAMFGNETTRSNAVDKALARWCVGHDISWAAVDSRDNLWRDLVAAMRMAPAWKAPPRQVLSAAHDRGAEARAGGLFLALQDMQSEKDKILAAAAGEGATVVSDGAKLKSRKRGMLNTGLSARKGFPRAVHRTVHRTVHRAVHRRPARPPALGHLASPSLPPLPPLPPHEE